MYHRMLPEAVFDSLCDKCSHMLGPAAKCMTCAKGPQHDVVLCLRCFHHQWVHTEHSGHMWTVHYQPTDAGVVADSFRGWLKPMLQSNMPTHKHIDAALAHKLEVHVFVFLCFIYLLIFHRADQSCAGSGKCIASAS